jgi:hypothetical protein
MHSPLTCSRPACATIASDKYRTPSTAPPIAMMAPIFASERPLPIPMAPGNSVDSHAHSFQPGHWNER